MTRQPTNRHSGASAEARSAKAGKSGVQQCTPISPLESGSGAAKENAPGTVISEARTLTQDDFDRFARISGDDNPIHVDPAFSARTRFGRTVSHGMLLSSVLWGMLHRRLPVTRLLAQRLMFPNPAYADEPLCFTATVERVETGRVAVAISVIRVSDGTEACIGSAEFALEGHDEGR